MSFSVATLKATLDALPPAEREAKESQLLADYARHAALGRPVSTIGSARIFALSPGFEEQALMGDKDVVPVRDIASLERALTDRYAPLLLIPADATIAMDELERRLEGCLLGKTIFLTRP